MERQLIKVAKELNIGMGSIVEYLTDKGFDVENKPNAKLSQGMYDALMKKFSDSKAEKLQADQIVIGTRPAVKPITPTPSVQAPPTIVSSPNTERKTISLFPPKETPPVEAKPAAEFIERPKVVLQQPRVLDKIDLNPKKDVVAEAPKPPVQQTPVAPEPAPAVNNVVTEEKKAVVEERKLEQPKQPENRQPEVRQPQTDNRQQPVVRNNQSDNRNQNDNRRNNDGRNNDNRRNQDNSQQNQNNPSNLSSVKHQLQNQPNKPYRKPEPIKPVAPVVAPVVDVEYNPDSETRTANDSEDLIRAETPQLRGLKIQGKIDIVKFIEKEKSFNGQGGNKNKNKNNNNNNNRGGRPGDRPPLGTAKPVDPTKKPLATDAASEEARKRKRKRKKIPTAPGTPGTNNTNTANTGNNTGGNQQNNSVNRGPNRPTDNRTGTGGNNSNTGNNTGPRRTDPVPVSQQQIEAKIKETMARLNLGGKNRGQKLRRDKREKIRVRDERLQIAADGAKLQVTEFISVSDLASVMDISPTQIITTCMSMGIFVSINQRLDAELIEVIASEFDKEVEFITAEEQVGAIVEEEPDLPEDLVQRAPVVTIMGHVDHGKTSLLDYVRKANVASGEAGGITQHIGAYEVKLTDGRKVTFLDTPGHEAFTAMRARGAKVTDVAVVIIAADDNIMPQTREAISHAQAAGVPIVFAINKIDKAGADPTRIKNELAQMNLLVEEWGGKFQSQDISAKQGVGVEELIEKILLEAEILDLKANPNKRATGTVVEASLDKGRGYVSKMLVQSGTLKIGDPMVAGEHAGKVKAMYNERGQKITSAGPATPVLVLGLSGAPQAGEIFKIMPSESEAKEIATKRAQIVREQSARSMKRMSLEEIGRRLALGTFKELNLIIKGDVDGSVEALADSLLKQSHETVQVNVIHKAVGAISESDVMLASASDAIIIGFQVRPSLNARKLAEKEGVEIKLYSIIYEAIQEIRSAIEGMLEPTKEEKILGTVEVREVYKISKIGTVAGCYVQEGKIERKNLVRIIRDGIVVFPIKEGQTCQLSTLKRFKDDVKEVKSGFECGLTLDNYNDIREGDFIEAYEIIEVKQKL